MQPAQQAPPQQGNGQNSNRADGKIPVTILTGFLGAGKTTLLNYVLSAKQTQHLNISVIENEWGEVNIDSELGVSLRGRLGAGSPFPRGPKHPHTPTC